MEKWGEDEGKRRWLFEWSLKRAMEAAKQGALQMEEQKKGQQIQ